MSGAPRQNGCPDCGMVCCVCFDESERDDGLDENGNPVFECAAYIVGGKLYCPIAGTEECDWECPE